MTTKMYMAINQYGETIHGLQHPRKDLLEKLGRKHAKKMYIDTTDGKTFHVGYIVAGGWYQLYEVKQWRKDA